MRVIGRTRNLGYLVVLAATLGVMSPTRAAEIADQPVILVAKPGLRDALYGATILVAKPVSEDRHIGFIVNRPTPMTLGGLFPDHGPSQKVKEPVYLGGPVSTGVIFALVQRRDSPGSSSLQIAPDLYLAHEREIVDRVIETESDHARFYAGLVTWRPGELNAEIKRGLWYVLDAEVGVVLRKSTEGMWEELVRRSVLKANTI